jgi:hypothetical protein
VRRDINFFSVYRPSQDSGGWDKFKLISLSLLAGSLIIVLGIYCYFKFADFAVRSAVDAENAYLQSSSLSQAKKTLESTKKKLAVLDQYKKSADRVSSGFAALPKIGSELFSTIAGMEPADTTVKSIAYSNGALTLNCTCTDNQSPAVFAYTLEKSGRFSNVNYSGVSAGTAGTGSGSAAANFYSFTVIITLKGGASS